MLVAVLGAGCAAGLGRPTPTGAATCQPNGTSCHPAHAAACCTGTCKKHKGKHKCAPAGKAFGCTTSDATNACKVGGASICPNFSGGHCVVVQMKRKKTALCVGDNVCSDCQSDADCVDNLGDPTARCIEPCELCLLGGFTAACVLPAVA